MINNISNITTLPHSIEAEQALLGVLIVNENRIVHVNNQLYELFYFH